MVEMVSQMTNSAGSAFLTIVGHGQNGDLSDRTVTAFNTTSTFVDGRQIGVHVTRITTTARNFFTSSRDLTQGIGIRTHISKNDQDVLLELISIVFSSGQSETRSNNTFNTVYR